MLVIKGHYGCQGSNSVIQLTSVLTIMIKIFMRQYLFPNKIILHFTPFIRPSSLGGVARGLRKILTLNDARNSIKRP